MRVRQKSERQLLAAPGTGRQLLTIRKVPVSEGKGRKMSRSRFNRTLERVALKQASRNLRCKQHSSKQTKQHSTKQASTRQQASLRFEEIIPLERAFKEEQNGGNLSFIAPSSEEL